MDKLFSCMGAGAELSPNNAQIAMGVTPKVTNTTTGVEVECGFVPDRVYLYYSSSTSVGWAQAFDLGDGVNTTGVRKYLVNVISSSSGSVGNVDAASNIVFKGENGFIMKPTNTSNTLYNKAIHYLAVKYIDKPEDVEDKQDKTMFVKGALPATTATNWREVDLGFDPDLLVIRVYKSSTSGVTYMFDSGLGESSSILCGSSTSGTAFVNYQTSNVLRITNGFKIKAPDTTNIYYNNPIYYYAVKYI